MAIAIAHLPELLELPEGLAVIRGGRSLVNRTVHDEPEFESLAFPRRVWADTDCDLRYHVYTTLTECVSVEATSAVEAIGKSGVRRPFKVVRGHGQDNLDKVVVSAGRLVALADDEREEERSPSGQRSAAPARDETEEFAADVPAVSLTREEVEALLNHDDDDGEP
jgi:hypothetical protein